MSTLIKSIKCMECGNISEPEINPDACPACQSMWLEAEYDLTALDKKWPDIVAKRPMNMWRYQELLPYSKDVELFSMGEGFTPLTQAVGLEEALAHSPIWIKDERQNPTGSFKDRQASSAVAALKAMGIDELVISSAGNAAVAYAAYCARAKIKLWVFLPSSVPSEKTRELALYGAEIIKITGTYDQAKEMAAHFSKSKDLYLDHGAKAISNKEGIKTIAYELVEQLGWVAPDWYIQAVSGGLGPMGVMKGFKELFEAGFIDKIPKLGIVQTEGCAPMVKAWQKGLTKAEATTPESLITVLSTGNPGFAYTHLKEIIDLHGGEMLSVDDGEAFRAMRKIARVEGFSVEPAASVAFAGLEKLISNKRIKPEETVVVNCSGHTFSAEKHVLESKYLSDLQVTVSSEGIESAEGLITALNQLDEQIKTIVLIDDNAHDRRLVRRMLQHYKRYRVFEANNGQEGIELVKQRKPELIVLDLTLPKMDGFAILGKLKKDPEIKNIPVLVVSGKDLDVQQREYLQQNAESFLQKGSLDGKQLYSKVIDVLGTEKEPLSIPRMLIKSNGDGTGKAAEVQPGTPTPYMPAPLPDTFEGDLHEEPAPIDMDAHENLILYIEDNVHNRRIVRKILTMQGYHVEEAVNGLIGLEKIIKFKPPLVLLDISLPELDGLEVVARVKANEELRNIPVIALTASAMRGDRERFLEAGCDDYLSKPIRAQELIKMVEMHYPKEKEYTNA